MKSISTLLIGLFAISVAHAGTPRFAPSSLNFGSVPVGSSATLPVDLDLASGSDRLRSLGVGGTVSMTWATTFGDFQLTPGTCNASGPTGSVLSPGTGCQFSLTYTPTAPGSVSAVVTVTDWRDGHWGNMAVTALAVPATPASIPTLSEWGLIGMSSVLAMFGLARMRRRQA